MRMNEATAHQARVLSDAEIAMVAGGTTLDQMMTGPGFHWLDDSHTFGERNGVIAADYDHDGSYEEGWRPDANCPNGWERTITGNTWYCSDSNPANEMDQWHNANERYYITIGAGGMGGG